MKQFFIPILCIIFVYSCHKETVFTQSKDAMLSFSTDTLHFDTVFTTIGSITLRFKVYNQNKQAVKTSVKLHQGSNSYFRLNIDGKSANTFSNLEIMGGDSIFIFAEVNVNPQNSNSPIIISDSIMFFTNGNIQNIQLRAYGQDVHLYNGEILKTQTWTNDKPYLIYNSVMVDSLETLTIMSGADLYFHHNASMLVKGTLVANGTTDERITFQGNRLDDRYKNAPGQWGKTFVNREGTKIVLGGIHFLQGSKNNIINNAIIKNGNIGVQVDYFDEESTQPTLTLGNTIITYMSLIGLEARTTNTLVYNSVIANCGHYCVRLMYGGDHKFYHTTLANYYPSGFGERKGETLAFNNYYIVDNTANIFPFSAEFKNCIIYGNKSKQSELIIDAKMQDETNFKYTFDYCLLKISNDWDTSDNNFYNNTIISNDSLPKFLNPIISDFRLDKTSAAKDKGLKKTGEMFPKDINYNDRTLDQAPDLGAYEYIKL